MENFETALNRFHTLVLLRNFDIASRKFRQLCYRYDHQYRHIFRYA